MNDHSREFGGFLPLELRRGREYFADLPAGWVHDYRCATNALYAVLTSFPVRRVWLPYYDCPNVVSMAESLEGVTLVRYYVGYDLLPDLSADEKTAAGPGEEDVFIAINYFGVNGRGLADFVSSLRCRVVLDCAQAFFEPPVLKKGYYCIYSCRKFIGVSDGAYVVSVEPVREDFPVLTSFEGAGILTESLEKGTNSCYLRSVEQEEELPKIPARMSLLTRRILENADYEWIREVRKANFRFVHSWFSGLQRLPLEMKDCCGYCYPLLLDVDIRRAVIARKVYVPTLWKELITESFRGRAEYDLSANTLFLPVDQRYNLSDMKEICEIVSEIYDDACGKEGIS